MSWFGTMASSQAPNSAVHRTRVKQRGSGVKPEVTTVSLAQGVFGGERRARIGQNKSNWTPGNSPRRWRRAQAYIDIMHALNSNIQLSPSLAQQFLFQTFCASKFKPISHAFLSFFSRCTMLKGSNISFLFTNSIIYIEIWQILLFISQREQSIKRIEEKSKKWSHDITYSRNISVAVCPREPLPSLTNNRKVHRHICCLLTVCPLLNNKQAR